VQKIIFIVSFLLLVSSVHAESRILGKWKDKNAPSLQFEFKENQDFVSTYSRGDGTKSITEGVWEVGSWVITYSNGTKKECNLSIYAGDMQCCLEYKFIAGNLILTKMHKSGNEGLCYNRVLIRGAEYELPFKR